MNKKLFIKTLNKIAMMKKEEQNVLVNGNQNDIDEFYSEFEKLKNTLEKIGGVRYGNMVGNAG